MALVGKAHAWVDSSREMMCLEDRYCPVFLH